MAARCGAESPVAQWCYNCAEETGEARLGVAVGLAFAASIVLAASSAQEGARDVSAAWPATGGRSARAEVGGLSPAHPHIQTDAWKGSFKAAEGRGGCGQ